MSDFSSRRRGQFGLGYHPSSYLNGLRVVSKEEMDARRKFVFEYDFTKRPEHKPLSAYEDNGKRTLPEAVLARHEDEVGQLDKQYKDFFRFPDSPQFRSYQQRKQEKEEDYKRQKIWVDMYQRNIYAAKVEKKTWKGQIACGSLFMAGGLLHATSSTPVSYISFSFLCLAGVLSLYAAHMRGQDLKELPKRNARIRMVLEDWHKEDRFARYDRVALNEELDRLNKEKPTQYRQGKKRALVAKYRSEHPRRSQRLLSDVVKERT